MMETIDKTIGVSKEVHQSLWQIRIDTRSKNINEVIKMLIKKHKEVKKYGN